MDKNPAKLDLFSYIRTNWAIIVFLVSLILAWGDIQNSIQKHDKAIDSLEIKQEAINVKIDSYRVEVSGLSGDIKAIREALAYIKERIK